MCDFCALSPIPRMRMSSIIRWRSGVTRSSVIETSCLMIEKAPIVRQVSQITKCAQLRAAHPISQKRQCRGAASSMGGNRTFVALGAKVRIADKPAVG